MNAVLGSGGRTPVAARVTLTGDPIPPARRGEDATAEGNHTTVRVAGTPHLSAPRRWRRRAARAGPLDLALEVDAGEFETFAFTCERGTRP